MKSQSVREGEQRLISCTRDLMCLGANGIGAKGQCGRNWPGSCSRSMCLMCSDIILVEINYLCWSEEVSREIPWLDMNRCPILQVTFLFVWGLFQFLVCFSCESGTRSQYSAAPGSGWQMTHLHNGRELFILHLQWSSIFNGRTRLSVIHE